MQKRSDECQFEIDPACVPGHPTQPCHHANMCTNIVSYLQRKTETQPDITLTLAPCLDPQNPDKEEPTLTMFVLTKGKNSFLDKVANQFLTPDSMDGARINMTLDYFGPQGKGVFLRCGYENGLDKLLDIGPSHWSSAEYRMGTYAPFVAIPQEWVSDWDSGVPFTGKLSLSLIINNAGLNNFLTYNHRMGIDQRGAHMRHALENEIYTDFYLVTNNGTRIGCHRSVLMERSPVFRRRIQSGGANRMSGNRMGGNGMGGNGMGGKYMDRNGVGGKGMDGNGVGGKGMDGNGVGGKGMDRNGVGGKGMDGNGVGGKGMDGNSVEGKGMGGKDIGANRMGGNRMGGNRMGGNRMGGNRMGGNGMDGNRMGGNGMDGNSRGGNVGDEHMCWRVPLDENATRAFLKYIYFWEIVDPLNDSWLAITLLQVGEAFQMWDLVLEMQHLMLAKSWTEGNWMGTRSAPALFQMGITRRKCGHCATNPVQAAWDALCWKCVWLLYWYALTLAVADFNDLFTRICEFSPELYCWLYMEFERRVGKDDRMTCALQAAMQERDENNNF